MELLKNCSIRLSEALCSGKIDTDTDRREEGMKGQHKNSVVDIRGRMGNKLLAGRGEEEEESAQWKYMHCKSSCCERRKFLL